MKPNYCTLPTAGGWDGQAQSSISLPRPLPHRLGIHHRNTDLPRCKTIEDFVDGAYAGIDFDQEWVPKSCSAVPLSPFVWTENTKCQATITMIVSLIIGYLLLGFSPMIFTWFTSLIISQGDSHVRNLFTATINGLRGIATFAEAHYGNAAKERGIVLSYEWRMNQNGTASDIVAVHVDISSVDPKPFGNCPCGDSVRRCLRIAFIWAPKFDDQLSIIHFVTKWKSDIVIVEPGNAYEHKNVLPNNWTARYNILLQDDEYLQLGVLHFPWGDQPYGREAALVTWTTNVTHAGRISLLRQSAIPMPEELRSMQGRKSFHFACSLGKATVENDLINAVEPCTDLTDTAQIRALITVHLDALSRTHEISR